ncbi:MAG: protein translocase subunit SecD [Anaerovoracaceae bacterium]
MNEKLKKVIAVLLFVILVIGWVAMVNGIGGIKPLKDKIPLGLDIKGGVYVVMEAKTELKGEELTDLMNQTKEVITRRVDQMGVANADVRVEGKNRIRVELPGADNAEQAIEQIGKTAQLKFTLADGTYVLDGGDVKNATIGQSQEASGYVVNLEFKKDGAKAFEEATKTAMTGSVKATVTDSTGEAVRPNAIVISLDNNIISAPGVDSVISGGKCEISGNFTKESATELAALIRGGALPAPLEEVTSSVQTAKIGINAFEKSVTAGIIAVLLIFIIMLVGYRIMGLAANVALALYILIMLIVMGLIGSVLTLPGIAGMILSVGMAVDANVIIFTRIKEEIIGGKSIRVAVQTGFKRAMSTVIDSQVTTLIAAVILYQIGTSAVKGFAWTLMVGIVISVLTAVVVTQLYLSILANSKRFAKKSYFGIKADNTANFAIKKQFKFIKNRKLYYIISIVVIVIGLGFGLIKGMNYGIDFTGGTMLNIDLNQKVSTEEIETVLEKSGIVDAEIVYGGAEQEEVIIKTEKALDNKERAAVVSSLQDEFKFEDSDVLGVELFGPTVGKELKNNAIKAVLLAALGMLIYIRVRFREWKFGAAALLGVLHDVLIVIAFYAVFSVTVNNPFIAGILTVVGYSINDTIVIFDRIRENNRFAKKDQAIEIIDKSINQTLSRSIMTTFTTLIVMVPLYIMTSSSLREFILPLMVGVAVGCISSIFVCSPLYYEFSSRKGGSKYEQQIAEAEKRAKRENKNESSKELAKKGHKKISKADRKKNKEQSK